MTESRLDIRTAETKKMICKLTSFLDRLREKIVFQQGQVEVVEDILKQLSESVEDVTREEEALARKEQERKDMQGVKTPKRKKKGA